MKKKDYIKDEIKIFITSYSLKVMKTTGRDGGMD